MFKSLREILFISFVGLVLFSLLIIALISTPRIRRTTSDQVSKQLLRQIELIKDHFYPFLIPPADKEAIQKEGLKISKITEARITVINPHGKVLSDSSLAPHEVLLMENHGGRPEIKTAIETGQGSAVRYSTTIKRKMIYAASSINKEDGTLLGILRFSHPATYASDLIIKTHKSMFVALLIAIIIAILISLLFARLFSKPITHLTEVSKRIAKGEFPITIMRRSPFEVGELERSIEEMSQQLSVTFKNLSATQNRINTMLASMTEGVLATDLEGKILLCNPAIQKMFLLTKLPLIGQSIREAIWNNEIADLIDKVGKGLSPIEKIVELITPVEAVFVVHASPIRSENGEFSGVVCVLYNITEIKKLERYRSEFVANVSHELKTPLTAIRNYVETLLAGAIHDRDNNLKFLEKIHKHAENLSRLIDDILEISRLEGKRDLPQFKTLNLKEITFSILEDLQRKAEKKEIKIIKECQEKNASLMGIEDQVTRAIKNIIDNALNYTPPKGEIAITCQREKNKLLFSVKDTGIGINKEDIPRIFERFYRADKARSREMGGTGLGLSIVKHIMKIHQGEVLVESHKGKGSTFTLIFPTL